RERRPNPLIPWAEQQQLDSTAGLRLLGMQARRYDAAVVRDQQITGVQPSREIAHSLMRDLARRPIEHQHAGLIALGEGCLGDKLGWEFVIEVVDAEVRIDRHTISSRKVCWRASSEGGGVALRCS